MVPLAKAGLSVPELIARFDNVATADGALVTVMVYVSVVLPSPAVTTVVIVFGPTAKGIAPEGVPEVTAMPLTFTVAVVSLVVGVTVMLVVTLLTGAA